MRALLFLALLAFAYPARISAQTYYDQQRQYREYKSLSEATQRAYAVPSRSYSSPSPSYSSPSSGSSSSYSGSRTSSYNYGGTSNQAIEQMVEQWRANSRPYTAAERAAMDRQRAYNADQARLAAERYRAARKAQIAAEMARQDVINRDADREKFYRLQRMSPEERRQYRFDSAAIPLRQFARSQGVHRCELDVYTARMNSFTPAHGLSANGLEYVQEAMQAHGAFLAQQKTADYETLAALMDAFVVLPASTLQGAKVMAKRFPDHRPDIMRAELRAINFFFGADFAPEYERQRIGLRVEDTMEMRWRAIYEKMPDDAVMAMKAVTEWQYNPVAQFADGCVDLECRLQYYTLLMRVPTDDAEKWLKNTIPAQHWEAWKASVPKGFMLRLLEENSDMISAITKRNKEASGK